MMKWFRFHKMHILLKSAFSEIGHVMRAYSLVTMSKTIYGSFSVSTTLDLVLASMKAI